MAFFMSSFIFRNRAGRIPLAPGILLAWLMLTWVPYGFALDPALDVSQYAHTTWKIREGFFKGTPVAIAQTPDGYLWLGTEFGLLRFDGVRYVLWKPPAGQELPSNYIRSLLAARDGTLWIGDAKGLASWKGGKLTRYPELVGQAVWALLEDREGTVWAGGQANLNAKLCAIKNGNIRCYGEDGRFGQFIDALYEDRAGNVWIGGIAGLWRWKHGPPKLYPTPDRVRALAEGDDGELVVVMYSGIRRLVDEKLQGDPLPATGLRFRPNGILRDRDGGLWIGTEDRGLAHVHQGRMDVFERSDGLSGNFIERIFEDREGNIWVATLDGLDRFRNLAVSTISVKQGLSNAAVQSVLVARDGAVWLGTLDGLNRWDNGRVAVYKSAKAITGGGLPDNAIESLYQDFRDRIWASTHGGLAFLENGRFTPVDSVPGGVEAITGDRAGNLWVSQKENLFHLRDGRVVGKIPWAMLGQKEQARSLAVDPSASGLWLAFPGAVVFFKNGQIGVSYSVAEGLGEGHIRDLQLDRDGALWAATETGASRLKDGRVVTLNAKNGLPCDDAHWVMEDEDQSVWVYMACGLAQIARAELDAWVVAATNGQPRRVQATVFDSSDGVRSHAGTTGKSPSIAKSADGRLWFLPWDGVSVVDPRRLPFNKLAPPVQIERMTGDGKTYDAIPGENGRLRLPPLVRDLEIDYTALSLVAPEKVHFRYKLESWESDWQHVGARRQAFYNNLPPGDYRFRVSACNNSGVWNEVGAFVDFSVAPVFYQTAWFQLACVAACLALLGAIYRLRLRHVERQFNLRLEERVSERTRIAQELHDTLLQGFISASMQLHVAADQVPEGAPEKTQLGGVLQLMEQVIEEGRNAVRGLRPANSDPLNIAQAFARIREELSIQKQTGFRVIVKGQPRSLRPILRDEVYRIGREAVLNAFRHAQANSIEVEIEYGTNQLRLLVRDDGCGIDPQVLQSGRDGHFGLIGMRERAESVGARLTVNSRISSGTEVDLSVSGHSIFESQSEGRLRRWFTGLYERGAGWKFRRTEKEGEK
jgi:signal transduction histidine kinase/ligand-binding sensor domain-containing protein